MNTLKSFTSRAKEPHYCNISFILSLAVGFASTANNLTDTPTFVNRVLKNADSVCKGPVGLRWCPTLLSWHVWKCLHSIWTVTLKLGQSADLSAAGMNISTKKVANWCKGVEGGTFRRFLTIWQTLAHLKSVHSSNQQNLTSVLRSISTRSLHLPFWSCHLKSYIQVTFSCFCLALVPFSVYPEIIICLPALQFIRLCLQLCPTSSHFPLLSLAQLPS